jgi:hypothetical protein
MTPLPARNRRFPSSLRSTMGRAVRSSTTTIAASKTTPAAMDASTWGSCQPRSGPSETPYISSPRPDPESRKPARSKRPGSVCGGWCTKTAPKTKAAAPIGTLT